MDRPTPRIHLLAVGAMLSVSSAFAQSDTTPPVLVDFDFEPRTVDVTAGPGAITCEMTLEDVPAGDKKGHVLRQAGPVSG